MRKRNKTNGWQPLGRARAIPMTKAQSERLHQSFVEAGIEMTGAEFDAYVANELGETEIWMNDRYQVAKRRVPLLNESGETCVHLSIKRIDRAAVRDWRDMQRIKNELLGPECEAVELYPAESRVVDTANSYHLWGFDDVERGFPLGWATGLRMGHDPAGPARQRDFDEDA